MIFSLQSEARSELRGSGGVEVGGRRSRCEGSSRGARSCGGCRARTRAEPAAPVTLLFLPGLQRACSPPMTSASPAPHTPPGRGPWSLPLSYSPRTPGDAPTRLQPLRKFTRQADGYHPLCPQKSSGGLSWSCCVLAMALQPGSSVLEARPLAHSQRAGGPLPTFPSSTSSAPPPFSPALLRCS